jgi:hypothetical protein
VLLPEGILDQACERSRKGDEAEIKSGTTFLSFGCCQERSRGSPMWLMAGPPKPNPNQTTVDGIMVSHASTTLRRRFDGLGHDLHGANSPSWRLGNSAATSHQVPTAGQA